MNDQAHIARTLRAEDPQREGDEALLKRLDGLSGDCALIISESAADTQPSVVLTVERNSWPTATDDFCISDVDVIDRDGSIEQPLDAAIASAEELAKEAGVDQLIASLEIVASDVIRAFEQRGYHASGQGPYRLVSGAMVEYLIGYTDCVGFRMDYSKKL